MEKHPKRLYRSKKDRVIAGVCAGIADYFDVDPVIVRILFVLFALWGGSGILLYIIAIFVIPTEPEEGKVQPIQDDIKDIAENIGEHAKHFGAEIKKQAENITSQEIDDKKESRGLFLGLLIILIGLVLFVGHMMPFPFMLGRSIVAGAIIALGFYLLSKNI
ncbi:MAG: Phage shock protein C, PspC [Parcubacteria group bacterium GW2011_GWC1_41_7]|nr:MAG: Phage shock protein C, PspC [Parcubacteria group bacterium GW2011_GWC1_41_7]